MEFYEVVEKRRTIRDFESENIPKEVIERVISAAMNTVFVSTLNKWIRLDARGNKEGVNAEFSTEKEKLAFNIVSKGEVDYHDNHDEPDKELMKVLEESDDALDMYLHHLPDQLSYTEEEHR